MTKRKNPAVWIAAGVTKRASRRSGIPLIEQAARVGIGQPRLSMILRGKRFGNTTRARVELLAITLGIEPVLESRDVVEIR
jgi:hypothetical protein